eukprot:3565375-Pyramimonas_sp.AAC.1
MRRGRPSGLVNARAPPPAVDCAVCAAGCSPWKAYRKTYRGLGAAYQLEGKNKDALACMQKVRTNMTSKNTSSYLIVPNSTSTISVYYRLMLPNITGAY